MVFAIAVLRAAARIAAMAAARVVFVRTVWVVWACF